MKLITSEFLERVENYCLNKMSSEEKFYFEKELQKDQFLFQSFIEYKELFKYLSLLKVKNNLTNHINKNNSSKFKNWVYLKYIKSQYFIFKNKSAIVAASVLITFSTIVLYLFSLVFVHSNQLVELKRDMSRSINKLEDKIKTSNVPNNVTINNTGTGFLIDVDGYILTSAHILQDAKDVYVENINGESFSTEIKFFDKDLDLALLRISDDNFKLKEKIPYGFKTQYSNLGEEVFTLGFPKDDIVFNQGYLSSLTGFNSDSLYLQLSIPLNLGNSGGPIFDEFGNILGVIKNKQKGVDNVSFALKSKFILKALKQMKYNDFEHKYNDLQLPKNNSLVKSNKELMIKKFQNFVYMIKCYS